MDGFGDVIDEVWSKPRAIQGVARLWHFNHEKKVKQRYNNKKIEKKKRDSIGEKEVNQLVARKVPFDFLAKDWLDEQRVSLRK